mgnify:CR=1 FL=1
MPEVVVPYANYHDLIGIDYANVVGTGSYGTQSVATSGGGSGRGDYFIADGHMGVALLLVRGDTWASYEADYA